MWVLYFNKNETKLFEKLVCMAFKAGGQLFERIQEYTATEENDWALQLWKNKH